jgi:hypothetical protein
MNDMCAAHVVVIWGLMFPPVGDGLLPPTRIERVVAGVIEYVAGQMPSDQAIAVMKPRRSKERKSKPVWPGVPKSDEPIVEIVFAVAGLIILIIMWGVYRANGGS